MNRELDMLRARFGAMLIPLFWAHVPLMGLTAAWTGEVPVSLVVGWAAALAAIYHLGWRRWGIARTTRHLAAVALVAQPAMLLLIFRGHPWQMDMHMYFFALLALNLGWFDRGALLAAATATTLHHLVLSFLLPGAVFANGGDLGRVLLHGGVVAFQTVVLIWVRDKTVDSFMDLSRMRDALTDKSRALQDRSEEAEAATRAKSMFLANMSHEIRTPINAVLGFCHLLQRSRLDPGQRDQLGKIAAAGTALLRLVNDLLDFSKNEAGKLVLEDREFDLRSAISCQAQMVAEDMRARGLSLRLRIGDDVPRLLRGDELRLNQVVLNLLSNAIKFSEAGEIAITARVAERGADRLRLEIAVSDCGIGMSDDQMGRLFAPFTQADATTTRRFGGTGLGLAICRQIVAQMDGWIRADSQPGRGSTFTFAVSLGFVGEDADDLAPGDALYSRRILLADGDPVASQAVAAIFDGWALPLHRAGSGPEMLERLRAADGIGQPFDLLIADWNSCAGIASDLSALRSPPTLIAMASADLAGAAPGADDPAIARILARPVGRAALLQAIRGHRPALRPQAPVLPAALQGQRVLLVEDNAINREIALAMLTDAGLEVDCAEDGQAAVDMVWQQGYAAVLMDLQMPRMDGLTATRRIRQRHGTQELPIIAMTSHAFHEEGHRCAEAGMNDHVSKPVDPDHLVAVLGRHLRPVAHGAQPAPTADPLDDLPDRLLPFDLASALRRVSGRAGLLRRLIGDFARDNRDADERLARLLAEGDRSGAHRLAHSLKGVAASLGLPDLAAVAAEIETAIAAGRDIGVARPDFALHLGAAVRAAESLDRPDAVPVVPVAGDPARIAELRRTLADLVRRRSLSARACFEDLADALQIVGPARRDHPLSLALHRLDYAAAAGLVDPFPLKPGH